MSQLGGPFEISDHSLPQPFNTHRFHLKIGDNKELGILHLVVSRACSSTEIWRWAYNQSPDDEDPQKTENGSLEQMASIISRYTSEPVIRMIGTSSRDDIPLGRMILVSVIVSIIEWEITSLE